MAIVSTKAIVLSSIKYADSSLIVRCFTLEEGVKSYMVKGVLKSKKSILKAGYFQPLTQLKIVANHNNKGRLNSFKEVAISNPYFSIYTSIYKQTIAMFLSEILNQTIKEEEKNEALFSYFETSFSWLDTHDQISNFHLLFLVNLTRFLGFYPDISQISKNNFNLLEGVFTNSKEGGNLIVGSELIGFKKLFGINFDNINCLSFSKNERQQIIKIIIKYYELHLEGFRSPKSLSVLESVFSL